MILRQCPDYDPSNALVQPLLSHVDCKVETIIQSAHSSLFGQFGQFGFLLTGCLTLLVAIYGFRLLHGGTQLSLKAIVPKLFLIGGLVAIVTDWRLFNLLFFGPFYASGEGLGLAFLDAFDFSQGDSIYAQLDVWIAIASRLTSDATPALEAAAGLQQPPLPADATPGKPPVVVGSNLFIGGALPKILLWGATIVAAFCSAGLMITSKITLGILLAIGPLLFLGVLFESTRGLFVGWLQFMLRIGLLQLLAVLFTAAMMQAQLPLLQQLEFLTMSAPQSKQVLIAMLLISLVFAALIVMGGMATKMIASGIRWPRDEASTAPAAPEQNTGQTQTILAASQQRITGMLSAIEGSANTSARSVTTVNRTVRPDFQAPPVMRAQQGQRRRSDSIATAFEKAAG
ncbi:MAG: type IV secretion system protein [Pseudomonadota bacterium]